jgi:hypothetical protein
MTNDSFQDSEKPARFSEEQKGGSAREKLIEASGRLTFAAKIEDLDGGVKVKPSNSEKESDNAVIVKRLIEENKILRSRVRELESQSDASMREHERLFEVARLYMKILEDQSQDKKSKRPPGAKDELEAVQSNARLDKTLEESKARIDEIKGKHYFLALFCMQMLEKYGSILKKFNYHPSA